MASTLKKVGESVKDLAKKAADGKFPGGKVITYILKDGGVDLTTDNLSADAKKQSKMLKLKSLTGLLKFLKNNGFDWIGPTFKGRSFNKLRQFCLNKIC